MANEICQTIFQQLGGGRAMSMIGGQAYADGNRLQVNFKLRGAQNKSNRFSVIYDHGSDTYIVKFEWVRGGNYKVRSTHEGIYCDMLVDLIERETGFYLSL